MNPDAFTGAFSSAVDQYTFDSIPGSPAALEEHWATFFTESDIQELAATGLNALRIPIGFWAYDNKDTPYQTGADKYLEKAIGWAKHCGMYVWVDLHGSPGSQNGKCFLIHFHLLERIFSDQIRDISRRLHIIRR